MQINKAPGTSPTPAPAPARPAAAPAEAGPAAPSDQVQLSADQQKGLAMLQDAVQARQTLGGQFVNEVLAPAPLEVKAVLQEVAPHVEQVADELAKQGLAADQAFLLATETQKLVQAGLNAEARAEKTPGSDRGSLLNEEVTFQNQANILLNAFPQQAAEVIQQAGAGETSAGPFVDSMFKLLTPDVVGQVKDAAAHTPLAMAAAEHPELLKGMADTLQQNSPALTTAAQSSAGYFQVIGQVMAEEMQGNALLMGQQPAPPQA